MYEQTLWKEIKDVVNPKILAKNNRFKKWDYGYNSDYDFIVISKTGKIGQIIEIQNWNQAFFQADLHTHAKV